MLQREHSFHAGACVACHPTMMRAIQGFFLVAAFVVLQHCAVLQAAPSATDCAGLSASTLDSVLAEAVELQVAAGFADFASGGVYKITQGATLPQPLILSGVDIAMFSAKPVKLGCPSGAGPALQISGQANVCLYNIVFQGCKSPVLHVSKGSTVTANQVHIANSTSRSHLIEATNSQIMLLNSYLGYNNISGGMSLIMATGSSQVDIGASVIEHNIVNSNATLMHVEFSASNAAAGVTKVTKAGAETDEVGLSQEDGYSATAVTFLNGSRVHSNTAGRLIYAASQTSDASTIVGPNGEVLSDSALHRTYNGSMGPEENGRTLMQRIAERTPRLIIQDASFAKNSVVLELLGLHRVHLQLHGANFTGNSGSGVPVTGICTANCTQAERESACCVKPLVNATSFPRAMPASWNGCLYKPEWWAPTRDCQSKDLYVLASIQLLPVVQGEGGGGSGGKKPCGLPPGSRIASHMIYAFNGTVYMTDVRWQGNNFTYGSLLESANHTSVLMERVDVEGNVAQTVVNVTATVVYLNKTMYQEMRFQDESYRDLNKPSDAPTFHFNLNRLNLITDMLTETIQSSSIYIHDSKFVANYVYNGVFRSWGTRDGSWNNKTAYEETGGNWYIHHVLLKDNIVKDISTTRTNRPAQWLSPSIIGFIHVNATLVNVTLKGNTATIVVNVEVSSVTASGINAVNNTARPGPLWFTRWATLSMKGSNFDSNNRNASSSLLSMDAVNVWFHANKFTNNHLAPSRKDKDPTSLVDFGTGCLVFMEKCSFVSNSAERIVYTQEVKHMFSGLTFDGNIGTSLHIYMPGKVFESSFATTNLTQLLFRGNKNASHGALYVFLGTRNAIRVNDSQFIGNKGQMGGAISLEEAWTSDNLKPAEYFLGPNVEMRENQAKADGGAVRVLGGNLNVEGTSIVQNEAGRSGGGIFADVLRYTITNTTITSNKALSGGGATLIAAYKGTTKQPMSSWMQQTKIHYNIAMAPESGITNASMPCGLGGAGGLCLISPVLERAVISNSSFLSNSAVFGGGLYLDCGALSKKACGILMDTYPDGKLDGNRASTNLGHAVMTSSSSSLHVQCSQMDAAVQVTALNRTSCPEWQWPKQMPNNASSLGLATMPSQMKCKMDRSAAAEYTSIISGTTLNTTVQLFDEARERVSEIPSVIELTVSVEPQDLVMVGNQPGAITGKIFEGGEFKFSNISVWPTLRDPDNTKYTITFSAHSSYSNYPIQPAKLVVMVPRCTLGEFLASDTHWCQVCSSLQSSTPLFSLHPSVRCEPCVANGNCSSYDRHVHHHGMLLPRNNHFQTSFLLPQVVRCVIPEACRPPNHTQLGWMVAGWKEELRLFNASSTGEAFWEWLNGTHAVASGMSYFQKNQRFMEAQCAPGYQGFMCGSCAPHYGRYFGRCQRCLSSGTNTILLLLAIAGLLVVMGFLTSGHLRKTLRKHACLVSAPKEATQQDAQPAAGPADALAFSSLAGGSMKGLTQQGIESFDKLSHIFKVLTTFVQVNSITKGMQWVAPRLIRVFFTNMDFTSSPGAWVSLDCSLQNSGLDSEQLAMARSILLILLPGICVFFAYLAWLVCLAWMTKTKQVDQQSWRTYLIPRLWLTAVQTCFFLYPMVTISIFDVFTCDPMEPATSEVQRNYWQLYQKRARECSAPEELCNIPVWRTTDKGFWTQNYATVCAQGRHATLMYSLGVPALIIFAFGVPAALVVLLWSRRHRLHELKTQMKFGFLYEDYKLQFSYWEAVIMARKVLLLIVTIAVPHIRTAYKQHIQVSSCILIMQVCFLLHLTYQPFSDPLLNRLETISIMTTIINLSLFTYWLADVSSTVQTAVTTLLLFLNISVLLYFGMHLAKHLWRVAGFVLDQSKDTQLWNWLNSTVTNISSYTRKPGSGLDPSAAIGQQSRKEQMGQDSSAHCAPSAPSAPAVGPEKAATGIHYV